MLQTISITLFDINHTPQAATVVVFQSSELLHGLSICACDPGSKGDRFDLWAKLAANKWEEVAYTRSGARPSPGLWSYRFCAFPPFVSFLSVDSNSSRTRYVFSRLPYLEGFFNPHRKLKPDLLPRPSQLWACHGQKLPEMRESQWEDVQSSIKWNKSSNSFIIYTLIIQADTLITLSLIQPDYSLSILQIQAHPFSHVASATPIKTQDTEANLDTPHSLHQHLDDQEVSARLASYIVFLQRVTKPFIKIVKWFFFVIVL
mgnify:CR=1 FL=1